LPNSDTMWRLGVAPKIMPTSRSQGVPIELRQSWAYNGYATSPTFLRLFSRAKVSPALVQNDVQVWTKLKQISRA
jgi:hypothetical protein